MNSKVDQEDIYTYYFIIVNGKRMKQTLDFKKMNLKQIEKMQEQRKKCYLNRVYLKLILYS